MIAGKSRRRVLFASKGLRDGSPGRSRRRRLFRFRNNIFNIFFSVSLRTKSNRGHFKTELDNPPHVVLSRKLIINKTYSSYRYSPYSYPLTTSYTSPLFPSLPLPSLPFPFLPLIFLPLFPLISYHSLLIPYLPYSYYHDVTTRVLIQYIYPSKYIATPPYILIQYTSLPFHMHSYSSLYNIHLYPSIYIA